MEIKAQVKHLRTSARKTRLVVNLVRGMQVEKALDQLKFVNKQVTRAVAKLINSAIANAENTYDLSKSNLFIKEIRVDEGATLKRWMPRAHGRATPIRKRTSHINVILGEIEDSGDKKAKKMKIEAPVKLGGETKKDKKEDIKIKNTDEKASEKVAELKGDDYKKHANAEGGTSKGFAEKVFRRKSG